MYTENHIHCMPGHVHAQANAVYAQANAAYAEVNAAYAQAHAAYAEAHAAHVQAIAAHVQAQGNSHAAGYVWEDEDEAPAPPGYRRMYVPPLPPPPPFPAGFGTPLPLPQPPPLYVRDFSQDFHHFPHHKPFQFAPINIPSPVDIKNIKREPGQVFNGVSVQSVSGYGKDKDGKTIKTGGSTVVINDNGDVKETKVGKNPPNVEDRIVMPSFHEFKMPKMPNPVTFKPFVFKPITFKPFVFKPITFKPIDMNYKPADGENYVAVSSSSHSESSNINGVKSNSGGSHNMVNLNGAVDQEAVEFNQGDDPDSSEEVESQSEE